MSNVKSAGGALHYFSKDNYYTEDEGLEKSEWYGRGASTLGLSGKIDKEIFFQLLDGNVEGQELGKWVKNEETGEKERDHRPGTDMTFSAPKSVSIMAEVFGKTDVREAHEAAVRTALSYVESNLAFARHTEDGNTAPVQTGNLVVAMFRHNTSRDLDPQTHTHAVILNATKRPDGQWRSIMNDEIYKSQRVIGAIYTAELANRLQALGYELTDPDEKGNFEIAGISREQIEHFSQRRAEIVNSLQARGIDIVNATAQQKEDATLMTRSKKVDVDHAELLHDWRSRAEDLGIDVAAIHGKAEAVREAGGVQRPDRLDGRQALEFAAAHLVEREAVVSKDDLLTAAIEHGSGRTSPTAVLEAFAKLQKEGHLVELPDGNFTTKKMLESEAWTIEQVRAQKGKTTNIVSPDRAVAYLDEMHHAMVQERGFGFSMGQRDSLEVALTTTDRYVAVQGLSGTGKTTMLRALNAISERENYTVRGMAPTGTASKQLQRETGIATDTVSMFIIKERQLQKDLAFAQKYAPDFVRKAELWVVDEAGFLAQRTKAQLDYMAEKAGAKIVYLGDKLQLQGVEAGKPFETAQKNGMETAYMTEINRQQTPDLIEAVDIITGRDRLKPGERLTEVELISNARAFAFMDKAGMVKEVEEPDLARTMVKDVLTLSKEEREKTVIITAFNRDRIEINNEMRAGLKQMGELGMKDHQQQILVSKGWTRAKIKEAQYYNKGDVVRFGKDYKAIEAKNGEYLAVVAKDPQKGVVVLRREDGSMIAWESKKYNKVEVYAAEARDLAQGDVIRLTRSEGTFKNGETATIAKVEGNMATLAIKGEKGQEPVLQDIDLSRSKHWDHAYASTVHSTQGQTRPRTFFHIPTPERGAEKQEEKAFERLAKVFGDRSFYVGATRASHELRIYTTDKDMAARAVAAKQDKTSAMEVIQLHEQGLARSPAKEQQPRPRTTDLTI